MVRLLPHPSLRRAALVGALASSIGGAYLLSADVPTVSADVAADRAAAARVKAAVAAESRKINATADGIAVAERRLAKLSAREAQRREQFLAAQNDLVHARVRLTRLEKRSEQAKGALGETLAAAYRRGNPDLATTVIDAEGISDAIEKVEFEQRVQQQNAHALEATRNARGDAKEQEAKLQLEEERFQRLAAAAAKDRDQANAVRSALLERQARQLAKANGSKAKLRTLQGRIRRAERAQIAATRAATDASGATSEAPRITGSSQADAVVARVVNAANQIATTPYVWGGGHGGTASGGYDCSGSVSYALAAGGLLSSPLASGGFMSWGLAGVGQRITIYANAGHMYMVVDGRRFDTTALRSGGTRWTSEMRSSAGFVARHPAGL
jgi:cell wall-associated NlpC family hydrolase